MLLSQRLKPLGVGIVDVPGDGNCMAWSLRDLLLGWNHGISYGYASTKAKIEMLKIRHNLARMWQDAQKDLNWQYMFNCFCADMVPDEEAPCTPPAKGKTKNSKEKADQGTDDGNPERLATPPKELDAKPSKKGKPPAAGKQPKTLPSAKPVPISSRAKDMTVELKQPQRKKRAKCLESSIPDLEHMVDTAMDEKPAKAAKTDPNSLDVSEMDESMLADESKKRKRQEHTRCKAKLKTDSDERKIRLDRWLANQGISYISFLETHRSLAPLQKASYCSDQGWKQFRKRLVSGQKPRCEGCLQVVKDTGLTVEDLLLSLTHSQADMEADHPKEKAEDEREVEEHKEKDQQEAEADDGLTESEKSIKYLKSLGPIVEFLDDAGTWKYQCHACCTRSQPNGKINKIPSRSLKSVKWFLDQHLDCPSHVANVRAYKLKMTDRAENHTDGDHGDEEDALEKLKVFCPGLCVNSDSSGSLGYYVDEFILWQSYCNLSTRMARHSYWHEKNSDLRWIRSEHCEKKFTSKNGKQSCDKCLELTEPRKVQRNVIKFVSKFYAAKLLQSRLFFPRPEVEELIQSIERGAFARRHAVSWKKIKDLKNAGLQSYVRRSFIHMADKSPCMDAFLGTVVNPCLKVHPTAVSSSQTCLAAQFVEALSKNEQTVAWIALAVSGIFRMVLDSIDNQQLHRCFNLTISQFYRQWVKECQG